MHSGTKRRRERMKQEYKSKQTIGTQKIFFVSVPNTLVSSRVTGPWSIEPTEEDLRDREGDPRLSGLPETNKSSRSFVEGSRISLRMEEEEEVEWDLARFVLLTASFFLC